MKKVILFLVTFFVGITCFMLSWMFFMNSGILNDNFEEDEIRMVEIIRAFDKMPFVNFGGDDFHFYSHGKISTINGKSFTVSEFDKVSEFDNYNNISNFEVEDKIRVTYVYDENYNKKITRVKKYLKIEEVVDYETCVQYRGYNDYHNFPRECTVGQVTFKETIEEVKQICESKNGNWIDEFNECEFISEDDCYQLDGDFFECESACRNNLEAETCIMMCVQVCKF